MTVGRKFSGEYRMQPIFFHVMDDSVDAAILTEVSRDPRATLAQLSERVGLGVSAVQARLRRLEGTGVIAGYRVVLDPEAVGRSLSAFIEITPLDPSQPDNAPELLEHLTAIEACHSIAGDAAYILFVRVSTPRDLEALIRDIRAAASVSTRTTVVLQTFFENRPIAL
jgi:Lrp/AsnC family leucine-responsive transcriptional regulator